MRTDSDNEPGRREAAMRRETLLQKMRNLVVQTHRDESGAILMLCFAACLFLFMVSLIIFDAGALSRDKVDVQMAADTAGYSQAAVKARSMNMISFANVGKRTISGIRNMYYTQYPHYMDWLSGQCSRCCCGLWCGCWTECFNCIGNWASLVPIFEGIDYIFFMIGRFAGDTLTDHLEALDTYQEEMIEYSPYWAFGEAIIRGVRNGANVVTTYPMPENTDYGKLPLEKDTGFPAAVETCLAPTYIWNPSSPGTLMEWGLNFAVLKDRSVSSPNIASKGPAEVVNIVHSWEGCFIDALIGRDARFSPPYYLTATGDDGESYMKKSNIIWAYRYNEDYAGQLRDNYDAVISKDYSTNIMGLPEGGVWSMARGEIYYKPDNDPNLFEGPHAMWMFHPSWIGKLRPVALKDEDMPVDPSDMWSEARTMAMKEAPLFGVDMGTMFNDLLYMEKVSRGMDGKIDGKEVLDGIAK